MHANEKSISRQTGLLDTDALTLAFCLLALLLPLAVFPYFPNQDGPAHVNAMLTLTRLHEGDPFTSAYMMDAGFVLTNWATTAVLAVLHYVVPVARLESALASLYVLLMAAGAVFTTRKLFQLQAGYALAFFPFVYTHMLHMGSYNFSLACALFLPLLGLCHRYLIEPSWKRAAIIGATLLLIFMLHIQVALIALACIGVYGLWIVVIERSAERWPKAGKLFVALLPVAIISALFILQHRGLPSQARYIGLPMKAAHLIMLSGVASYSIFGLAVSAALFAALIGGAFLAARKTANQSRLDPSHALLACALFIMILFWIAPDGIGDAFNIEERLMAPMLFIFASWLVLRIAHHVPARTVALAASILVLFQTADRVSAFAQVNHDLAEYAEVVPHIPESSALIAVNLDQIAEHKLKRNPALPFQAMTRFDPERHFMGAALGDRHVVLVSNYEALAVRPYFALKYRPWLSGIIGDDDLDVIAAKEMENGSFSQMIAQLRNAPAPVAYLALWQADNDSSENPKVKAFMETVNRHYRQIFASGENRMRLYQLNQDSP